MRLLMLIIAAASFLIISPAYAAIGGRVIDAENGNSLSAASVKLMPNGLVFKTIDDGKFSFDVNVDSTAYFIISRSGYKTEKHTLENGFDLHIIALSVLSAQMPVTTVYGDYAGKLERIINYSSHLDNKELTKNLNNSLASTLKNQAGISMRTMGAAPARPVIRGLNGNRVAVLQDGASVNDMSGTSPDHAVTIDPSGLEKIEIVRGPKTLLYTPIAFGGAVNAIKNTVPVSLPENISGSALIYCESVNNGYSGSADVNIPISNFVVKAAGETRKTQNMRADGHEIANTSINNSVYSIGSSFFTKGFSLGGAFENFSTNYGIPGGFIGAHPKGVDIEMNKQNVIINSMIDINSNIFKSINLKAGRTYYRHKEFESNGSIGAEYLNKVLTSSFLLDLNEYGALKSTVLGADFSLKNNNTGGYVFTPATQSDKYALYFYNSINIGNHYLDFAARYENNELKPEKEYYSSKIGYIRNRSFNSLSLSLSVMHEVNENIFLGLNLSKSSRAPSEEELYSEGPHLAAYSFETGNPDLKLESGYGAEIFSHIKSNNTIFTFNIFADKFDYFIIPENTGKINYAQLLPIYSQRGVKAMLAGGEATIESILWYDLNFKSNISFTYGESLTDNTPLPSIPPAKLNIALSKRFGQLNIGAEAELASDQNRVHQFEESTKGYAVFSLNGSYNFQINETYHLIAFNYDNIFNTVYRNHLSRIKSVFPETGANIRITYKVYY